MRPRIYTVEQMRKRRIEKAKAYNRRQTHRPCEKCGGPLPCEACAKRYRRDNGLTGKEPEIVEDIPEYDPLVPPPEVMAARAEEIRKGWDERERHKRAGTSPLRFEEIVTPTEMRDLDAPS